MLVASRHDYPVLLNDLKSAPAEHKKGVWRQLAKNDLYFLLRYACGRIDLENDWCFERAREVQAEPNGCLDLWAREHFKSSLITFGMSIKEILNDPEITIGIFSHTRPIAKGFLRQIKREFEANEFLKNLFSEVLWANPRKESPKWSEDDGIVVKRRGNPKEATVEAWGLVDGQPTAKHYKIRNYDDIVVPESVTTPDMIAKTTRQWELSDNLGSQGGTFRVAGTRYHFSDTYGEMMRRKVVKARVYPCTKDGTENFHPDNCQLMSPETLAKKRRVQGQYTFGTQMLLNPKGDSAEGFQRAWLAYSKGEPHGRGMNKYIIVDPANSKKKGSDWTTMGVIGLGADRKYVLLDLIRDRLNLGERTKALLTLHEKWLPLGVGYEEYGLQSDIQHIEHIQNEQNYRFKITPLGGSMAKVDRIKRLIPIFEQGNFYLPVSIFRTIYDKTTVNLIDVFIEEEYVAFPVATHDDMLDMLARILDEDMEVKWPLSEMAKAHRQASQATSYIDPTTEGTLHMRRRHRAANKPTSYR
jgi:phage terminase large subunit-like protein